MFIDVARVYGCCFCEGCVVVADLVDLHLDDLSELCSLKVPIDGLLVCEYLLCQLVSSDEIVRLVLWAGDVDGSV